MIKTWKSTNTKNGKQYHFWDEENVLLASVTDEGKIINDTRELTEEEIQYIKDIASL